MIFLFLLIMGLIKSIKAWLDYFKYFYLLGSIKYVILFYMKLMHHKGRQTQIFKENLGRGLTNGHRRGIYLFIFLHPVINIFWHFIQMISSTVSNTLRKLHVHEISGSSCIVGTRPLFFRLSFFRHNWCFHIMPVVMQ